MKHTEPSITGGAPCASQHYQLLLLTVATLAGTYGRAALLPLQETLRTSLALSDYQVAWLQGPAMAVAMGLGSIPAGLLVDRFSRARLFVVFAAISLVATALSAFAANFALLFAARCLAGLGSAGTLVAAFSMLGDLYTPAQRGRAVTATAFGEIGGTPAAFALGGALLALSSASTPGFDSWRWALLWMCAPLALVVLLMLLLREPVRTGVIVQNPPLRQVGPELWRYRAVVLPLLLARIMVWIADGAVIVWAAPTFMRVFGLPPERTAAVMAGATLAAGVLGPVLGGPLADLCQKRGGPRRTMTAMGIVAALSVPVALFPLMPSAMGAAILLGAFFTCGFTIGTAGTALATIVVPGELRGLYLSVTTTVGVTFSFGLAPLVVSALSGALGGPAQIGQALAVVCVITSVLGAMVFGFGRRYFPAGTPRSVLLKASLNETSSV